MSALDYYHILGISPRSSLEEVRRRYRTLAMQYHPDRNPDDPEAAAHFRQVVEAFEAIQSAKTRKKRQASQNYRSPRFTDREHLFQEFFGIPRAGAPLQRSAGANFRYDLQIPFASAIRGMQTVIELDRPLDCHHCRGTGLAVGSGYRDCPDCQGRGRRFGGPGLLRFGPLCDRCGGRGRIVSQACGHCHGAGCQPVRRQYRLQIPPGTEDGTRLRFSGEGGSGFQDGPAGSLEVVIHVAPDKIFTRVGNDIHCPRHDLLCRGRPGRHHPDSHPGGLPDLSTAPGHPDRLDLPVPGSRRPRPPPPTPGGPGQRSGGDHPPESQPQAEVPAGGTGQPGAGSIGRHRP